MPRQTNSHRSHHKTPVHTKTHTVTNTKLAVAVMAAILAGGLAYASAGRQQQNQCIMTQMEYVDGDSCRRNKYKAVEYVCSDGESGVVQRRTCQSTRRLQRDAERRCARRMCAVQEAEETNPTTQNRETTESTQITSPTETIVPTQTDVTPLVPQNDPAPEVIVPQPDLTVSLLRFNEDQSMLLIRVENAGTALSESIPVVDGALVVEWKGDGADQIDIQGLSLSQIQPGAHFDLQVAVPQSFVPNQVRVQLDEQNRITESNETNNSRFESVRIGSAN